MKFFVFMLNCYLFSDVFGLFDDSGNRGIYNLVIYCERRCMISNDSCINYVLIFFCILIKF